MTQQQTIETESNRPVAFWASSRGFRVFSLVIFASSFFLPACRDGTNGTPVYGGMCALWSFVLPFTIPSGCINPLILIYVVSIGQERPIRTRRILVAAVLFCILWTWVFFGISGVRPMIGLFLWIAGILLILVSGLAAKDQAGEDESDPVALKL